MAEIIPIGSISEAEAKSRGLVYTQYGYMDPNDVIALGVPPTAFGTGGIFQMKPSSTVQDLNKIVYNQNTANFTNDMIDKAKLADINAYNSYYDPAASGDAGAGGTADLSKVGTEGTDKSGGIISSTIDSVKDNAGQIIGTGLGIIGGTLIGQPVLGSAAGSWLGSKYDESKNSGTPASDVNYIDVTANPTPFNPTTIDYPDYSTPDFSIPDTTGINTTDQAKSQIENQALDIQTESGKNNGGASLGTFNINMPEVNSNGASLEDYQANLSDGELALNNTGAYYTPSTSSNVPSTDIPTGENTVEGRLQGLLLSESPYLKAAQADAVKASNRRGLVNSTMAATAGEKAAIDAALPIAQQDAGYLQNLGLQENQGKIQEGLYKTQGDISSALSAQGFQQDKVMQDAELAWNKLDLQARMDVETTRLSEENKAMFNETVNSISNDYMNDYMEIMANPNFATPEDKQTALNALAANTQQRYDIAAKIAGVELTWSV